MCAVTAGSSGMETLVENVDRSAIVLVFLSNRLKNSAACRSGTMRITYRITFCDLVCSERHCIVSVSMLLVV